MATFGNAVSSVASADCDSPSNYSERVRRLVDSRKRDWAVPKAKQNSASVGPRRVAVRVVPSEEQARSLSKTQADYQPSPQLSAMSSVKSALAQRLTIVTAMQCIVSHSISRF
jgi:hypothetical protein